jgi:hypothetical protein
MMDFPINLLNGADGANTAALSANSGYMSKVFFIREAILDSRLACII